jgi:hypothetical protein
LAGYLEIPVSSNYNYHAIEELALSMEIKMGHAIHIRSREQYLQALRVLDKVKGTWRGIGPSSDPVLLLTEAQYKALLKAGVVLSNDKKVQPRGKKAVAKKTKSCSATAIAAG